MGVFPLTVHFVSNKTLRLSQAIPQSDAKDAANKHMVYTFKNKQVRSHGFPWIQRLT